MKEVACPRGPDSWWSNVDGAPRERRRGRSPPWSWSPCSCWSRPSCTARRSSARERVVARFHDRAVVVSALTQADLPVRGGTVGRDAAVRRPEVSDRVLDRAVAEGSPCLRGPARQRRGGHRRVPGRGRGRPCAAALAGSGRGGPRGRPGLPVGLPARRPGRRRRDRARRSRPERRGPAGPRQRGADGALRRVPGQLPAARPDARRHGLRARQPRRRRRRARRAEPRRRAPSREPGWLQAVQARRRRRVRRRRLLRRRRRSRAARWRVVLTVRRSRRCFSSVSGSRQVAAVDHLRRARPRRAGFLVLLRRLLAARRRCPANASWRAATRTCESTNALLRQAAELARSNAELEQFASIASHDLQEPLRKVQTFAAQLNGHASSERLTEEGQDFLRRMSDAAGRMRALIDDLLMFSRVSTKGRPFVRGRLSTTSSRYVLVDLEVAHRGDAAPASTIDDLPTIAADPVQMRQLLQNLLGERAEVPPRGRRPGDRRDARTSPTASPSSRSRDNGIGFDAAVRHAHLPRLRAAARHQRLPRAPASASRSCRKIVERHHGTITADGALGAGCDVHRPPPASSSRPTPTRRRRRSFRADRRGGLACTRLARPRAQRRSRS